MANPTPSDEFRNVSVLARGPVLQAIMSQAEREGLSLGKAAASLIEQAMKPDAPASTLVNLEHVSTDDLIDELVGGLRLIDDAEQLRARAEAAEAKLLNVASAIGAALHA